jgi:hypothetical protein
MLRGLATTLVLAALAAAPVRAADSGDVHVAYDTYAIGLPVATMQAGFGLGPSSYQVQITYQTTGIFGLFYPAQQANSATGTWDADQPVPLAFVGDGMWRGVHRVTLIDYQRGLPLIRDLQPPNETERQPVPPELLANTVDSLSALAGLLHNVDATARCDTTVHTYDGRRLTEVTAHTTGIETLEPTDRSMFSGPALRCDFEGRVLAGFLLGDSDEARGRLLHGSAWLAKVVPGGVPLPVRIVFETRWFGVATMYLTKAGAGPLPPLATVNSTFPQ